MEDPSDIVLRASGLCKSYQSGPESLPILNGLNLSICRGETVSIMGSSGAGKSTLLNQLGVLDQPDSGELWLAGQAVVGMSEAAKAELRNRHLGFVFQFHHLLPEFTALENVAMPLRLRGMGAGQANARAENCLSQVGLQSRLTHKPAQLSGGERQRVAIARALVGEPSVLLMDEPTGNLDQGNAAAVIDLITSINKATQVAIMIVTHDPGIASRMQHCFELSQGILVEKHAPS